MLLLTKRIHPRCRYPSVLVSFPAVAFLFLAATRLRRGDTDIARRSGDPQTTQREIEMYHDSDPTAFPLVEEFHPGSWRTKKFDNEDARIVGFPVSTPQANGSITKLLYLATPYFHEWNPRHFYFLHSGQVTFARYSCPVGDCRVTREPSDIGRADAVLFHLRDLEVYSFPRHRSPNQTWILYSMEPPWLEVKDMARFEGVFNWTMSYRRGSDVLVRYGFIGRRPLEVRPPLRTFERKRDRAVWFVSNCQTDSNREQYVERLMGTYPVDVVGGCGKEGCRPAETGKCYSSVARRYRFYLAFENAICRDYVTEKLFNPLEYDVVPVVLGGVNYSRIVPENSVIDAMEFATPEDLGRYLWRVSRNETLYLSYFGWKRKHRSYLQPWMCDLCEKLHARPAPKEARRDLEGWWQEGGSCRTWTPDGLRPAKRHPFPQYHVKLFD